ncbi:MAG TPA: ABC transporter substrate-binding protein [Candidatus Hydrogenedentes bacterium]|nr:ABC transporter substrate-binding protein [Candidatus Hydrogenedentota bacterium]HPG67344.1 ABC transporter substrate-binding protein [Candidatus Hydrogenedentota bacterium]
MDRWLFVALLMVTPGAIAYQEAPMLAEAVARGELPPVAKRLPEDPAVVEPVDAIGTYGGSWRRLSMGAADLSLLTRLGYEPLVRWDRQGKVPVPGLAASWDIEEAGRQYVFHLRRGLKWSDGAPLTSEDFVFHYEDVLCNKELSPVFQSWLVLGGTPVEVTAPDPYTVVFEFVEPYGIFLEMLCFRGNTLLSPKHYLRQFHARYVAVEELNRLAAERGVAKWFQLFQLKANVQENPDLPTWNPFRIVVPPPATRMVAERNPYYWKVDPAGNQLPYIDRIVYTDIQNGEMTTIKAMAGEVDFQARRINPADYPLFMENRQRGGYRVLRDLEMASVVCYINQYSKDEELRPILQDRRFRIALSVAIDREELIDLLYTGMAEPCRGIAGAADPFYLPEFDAQYLEYDPERANGLLDEVGLTRGPDGLRVLPSGRPFRQVLNIFQSESGTGAELWQLVGDYWREVGLDFMLKLDAPALSSLQVRNGNSDFWAYATAGMHWILDPTWYVPWQSSSYFAPLYGRYYETGGKKGIKPPPAIQQLLDWYLALRASMDPAERLELGRNILRQWAEECYTIGICHTELLTIVSNRFKNVPEHILHSYRVMTPGYIGIEQFYIDEEGQP